MRLPDDWEPHSFMCVNSSPALLRVDGTAIEREVELPLADHFHVNLGGDAETTQGLVLNLNVHLHGLIGGCRWWLNMRKKGVYQQPLIGRLVARREIDFGPARHHVELL